MSGEWLQRSVNESEEYEWAGVIKTRTTYEEAKAFAGSRLVVVSSNENDEIVDVERTSDFGDDQYSENDLRIEELETANKSSEIDGNRISEQDSLELKTNEIQTSITCSICLDNLHKPVVSTACWHIYCEQCWIRCLQVEKLCPKCNVIVLASNLRRVYL